MVFLLFSQCITQTTIIQNETKTNKQTQTQQQQKTQQKTQQLSRIKGRNKALTMPCLAPSPIWHAQRTRDGEHSHAVSCGKCTECLKKRAAHWSFRLQQEQKNAGNSVFLTLTYNEENIVLGKNDIPTLYKKDYQDFIKRLRKNCKKHYTRSEAKNSIKYYACGEYGSSETSRPHYHAILFNHPDAYRNNIELFEKDWGKGIITATPVTPERIYYTTGYVIKTKISDECLDERNPEFSLMSKNLGLKFLTPKMIQYIQQKNLLEIRNDYGYMGLPQYYKRKVWEYHSKNIHEDLETYRKKKQQLENAKNEYKEKEFQSPKNHVEWTKDQVRIANKQNKNKRNQL